MITQKHGPPHLGTPLPLEGTSWLVNLAAALDQISEGAALLKSEGELLWHNHAFEKLVLENSEGHLLVTEIIEVAADFYRSARSAAGERGMTPRNLNVGGIDHRLYFTVLPKGAFGPEAYMLCLIKRSTSRWSSYEHYLRQNWGLTEREAQVAVECLLGRKNREIAERLKISVETVNKHLDKVYQKVGVRGRAELASLLLDSGL
jgi:DNA-binding CsgD family transcriptional regulator